MTDNELIDTLVIAAQSQSGNFALAMLLTMAAQRIKELSE